MKEILKDVGLVIGLMAVFFVFASGLAFIETEIEGLFNHHAQAHAVRRCS